MESVQEKCWKRLEHLGAVPAQRPASPFRRGDVVKHLGKVAEDDIVVTTWHQAFEEPFMVGEKEARLGASIGIVVRSAAEATVDDLIEASDRAMYAAKRRGGGCSRNLDVPVTD